MSTLIPNRQWAEIKEMAPKELRFLRACEVYDGDIRAENYLYTHIPLNPHDSFVADNIRTKAEYLGQSTNSIYPVPQIEEKPPKYPNLVKAREARLARLAKERQ